MKKNLPQAVAQSKSNNPSLWILQTKKLWLLSVTRKPLVLPVQWSLSSLWLSPWENGCGKALDKGRTTATHYRLRGTAGILWQLSKQERSHVSNVHFEAWQKEIHGAAARCSQGGEPSCICLFRKAAISQWQTTTYELLDVFCLSRNQTKRTRLFFWTDLSVYVLAW